MQVLSPGYFTVMWVICRRTSQYYRRHSEVSHTCVSWGCCLLEAVLMMKSDCCRLEGPIIAVFHMFLVKQPVRRWMLYTNMDYGLVRIHTSATTSNKENGGQASGWFSSIGFPVCPHTIARPHLSIFNGRNSASCFLVREPHWKQCPITLEGQEVNIPRWMLEHPHALFPLNPPLFFSSPTHTFSP